MRLGKILGVGSAIVVSVIFVLASFIAWQLGVFNPRPAAHPVPAETRDGRWEQDINYFASELPRLHYNLFAYLTAEEFETGIADLRQAVPTLTDQEIRIEFARIVAGVGDGHTQLAAWMLDAQVAPISLRWFSDGLFIALAGEDHEDLLGAEVLGIGGFDLATVMESISKLVPADNEPYMRRRASRLLRQVSLLHELDFAEHPDTAVLEVVTGSSDTIEISIPAGEYDDITWVSAEPDNVPLYRQREDEPYWLEYLEESRTLFFKYNSCRGREGFRDLAAEARELIEAGNVDRMVIDFRGNGGGSSIIFDFYLLRHLKKLDSLNQEGRLYSVIDVATFSSAVLNSIKLERETAATTVGTPTGGKPNHFGEIKYFTLPNSGMDVWYSTKHFEAFPELGDAPSFEPEVHIPLSSEDYFGGRDPVMEWILSGGGN